MISSVVVDGFDRSDRGAGRLRRVPRRRLRLPHQRIQVGPLRLPGGRSGRDRPRRLSDVQSCVMSSRAVWRSPSLDRMDRSGSHRRPGAGLRGRHRAHRPATTRCGVATRDRSERPSSACGGVATRDRSERPSSACDRPGCSAIAATRSMSAGCRWPPTSRSSARRGRLWLGLSEWSFPRIIVRFVEEPALRAGHATAFAEYARRTRRFI